MRSRRVSINDLFDFVDTLAKFMTFFDGASNTGRAGERGARSWPQRGDRGTAWGQQSGPMRRVGVLMAFHENDPGGKALLSGFTRGLAVLGWTEGRTVRMDVRWPGGNVDRMQAFLKELVELQPDVILAHSTPATVALQRETRTIPIVFSSVSDPVFDRFVAGLPRPGGNITGFTGLEAAIHPRPSGAPQPYVSAAHDPLRTHRLRYQVLARRDGRTP
jgi:hypothetical protein